MFLLVFFPIPYSLLLPVSCMYVTFSRFPWQSIYSNKHSSCRIDRALLFILLLSNSFGYPFSSFIFLSIPHFFHLLIFQYDLSFSFTCCSYLALLCPLPNLLACTLLLRLNLSTMLPPWVTPYTLPLSSTIRAGRTVVQLYPGQAPTPMGPEMTQQYAFTGAHIPTIWALERVWKR